MEALGRPPGKSSRSGAAERSRPRRTARRYEGDECPGRGIQVVPRILIRPEPVAWGGFLLGGEMVFLVRETLTEEDRAAWRRLAARRKKKFRSGYGVLLILWFLMKLLGLTFLGFVGFSLFVILPSESWIFLKICFLIEAACFGYLGLGLLRIFFRPPIRPDNSFKKDFPPSNMQDTAVRAVFFGDGCFTFWDTSGKIRLGYSAITSFWEDAGRFYIFFQDRPPLVLPKRGFAGGMPEDFRDFLENTLGFPVERVK